MLEYFVLLESGELNRLPFSVMEKLSKRGASIPALAGKRMKTIEVRKSTGSSGAPESVDRVIGFYLVFDSDGFPDEAAEAEDREFAWKSLAAGFRNNTSVVDLNVHREKQELEKKHRWDLSAVQRQLVVDAALGHPRKTPNIKSIKHARPPEPTVTYEARKAFDALCEFDWRARLEVSNLSEEDLGGLKCLLEEKLGKKDGSGAILKGMIQRVDERLRVRQVQRTGEGEWYAIVELTKWAENNSGEVVHDWSQRCPTRQEALQLVRRLTAENAHHIAEHMSLESRVVSALEWDTDEA